MRKVIFISFVHLTNKYSRDWNIDYLIANGVDVEYWDIVALTREKYIESHIKASDYARTIDSFSEFESALGLAENKAAIYFMMIPYAENFVRVFRLVSKYGFRMVCNAWGACPGFSEAPSIRLLRHLGHPLQLAKKVFAKAHMKLLMKTHFLNTMDTVFAAGDVMANNQHFAKRVVPVNLVDYDHYVRARKGAKFLQEGLYAVFLDIYLPYQADLKVCGLPAVTADSYYSSINRFFDLVESRFGLKMVIAAHPKSDYNKDTFKGREFYRDRTAELVRDAEFVITHTSTALSYAILNSKPTVFVYTDEMFSLYENTVMRQLRAYSNYLDAPLLNIDKVTSPDQIEIRKPRLDRYERYKYDYLTTHASENTSTADIFFRELAAM